MNETTNKIEVSVQRAIPAPPAEVFNAWLDPAVPGNPWHESDRLLLNAEVDGLFHWTFRNTAHYGRFITLDRPTKLQHTWVSPNTLGLESIVTATFEEHAGGTLMTLLHTGLPDDAKGRSHEKGWAYFMDKLVEAVSTLQKA